MSHLTAFFGRRHPCWPRVARSLAGARPHAEQQPAPAVPASAAPRPPSGSRRRGSCARSCRSRCSCRGCRPRRSARGGSHPAGSPSCTAGSRSAGRRSARAPARRSGRPRDRAARCRRGSRRRPSRSCRSRCTALSSISSTSVASPRPCCIRKEIDVAGLRLGGHARIGGEALAHQRPAPCWRSARVAREQALEARRRRALTVSVATVAFAVATRRVRPMRPISPT